LGKIRVTKIIFRGNVRFGSQADILRCGRNVRFTRKSAHSRTFYISRKGKSRQAERLFLSANIKTDYRDFGVGSSFSGFAVLLPEPVVPGFELIALALDFCALELTALA
jgi:hypothetical protein